MLRRGRENDLGTDALLLVLAALLAGAMVIGGVRSLRAPFAPTGYWTLGWAALAASGGFTLLARTMPGVSPLAPVFGTLFSPLILAGCLQHVERPVPRWLLPAGVAVGIGGLLGHLAGSDSLEISVMLGIQPALLLLSAWILRTAPPHWSVRPVQLGLLGLAAVSVADGLAEIASPSGADPILAWLLLAVPTAALQTIAGFDRVRLRGERTETARRFESDRFHALLSSLDETPVLLLDSDGGVQEIVSAPREEHWSYGVSQEEVRNLQVSTLLSPEELDVYLAAIRNVLSTGRSQTISIEPDFPTGKVCLEIGLSQLHGTESIIGVIHDVTEHVQATRALRKSEQRLHALLAALAANRVVVIDRSGTIQSVVALMKHNPTPYGLQRGQVEGMKIVELLPGAAGERILATLEEVFESCQNRELEERVRLPNGDFDFAISLRPMLDESGETENVLAVVTDITEQIREASERKEFEAQIQQAQKLESIGVLAGGIAHDFNNLLTGILGNIELALEDAPSDSALHHYLRDIEDASVQAADLTSQLLAYAGKTAIAPSVIEIGTLTQEMAPLLRTGLVGGADLRIRHIGEKAWIRADPTQIRQVLMNLASNALEALPKSGGRVEIETCVIGEESETLETAETSGTDETAETSGTDETPETSRTNETPETSRTNETPETSRTNETPEGGRVCIEVRDNGCGMDAETQQRMYEPFYSTKFEGRGLGLAGALGIVRSHQGELQVESQPGEGSVFRVLLPRVPSTGAQPQPKALVRDTGARKRGTILVVDDERAVRTVATRMLERLGYHTICAASGREALALLVGAPGDFDAALIDLTMPDWPGERAAAGLRRVREDLPIVFMTGHSEREALERTRGIDRTHFLAKPFRRELLAKALSELLETG
jgi:PAS domain S-box-containing protein